MNHERRTAVASAIGESIGDTAQAAVSTAGMRHRRRHRPVADAPLGMASDGLASFNGRRVLLLQGPMGPFFDRLARDLRAHGAWVAKVGFNGGDRLFSSRSSVDLLESFRGHPDHWPAAFLALLDRQRIDTVLLFGDCRPVHVEALVAARGRGLRIGVFEEGYLRPDFITIESGGVNQNSPLPQNPEFYRAQPTDAGLPTHAVGRTYWHAAMWGAMYCVAASLAKPLFRHYRHHRSISWREAGPWLRAGLRKYRYRFLERHLDRRLMGDCADRYFLVALQTQGDAQITVHSHYGTVTRFIREVVESFAKHAPKEVSLFIKHHPLDRGHTDYSALIGELVEHHGLQSRCHYIHDQHLPTLIAHCVGVVTVNSTVGMSAIDMGTPVKTCGHALYDMPGLTFQGPLAEFWRAGPDSLPDRALWQSFRAFLIAHTQFNGSFYRRLPGQHCSGIRWDRSPDAAVPAGACAHGNAAPVNLVS